MENNQTEPTPGVGQALIEGKICELVGDKYYDAETGEWVADAIEEGFRVKDEASFNWVMSRMLNAEAELAAIVASAEVIAAKAVLDNAAKLEKKQSNRLNWYLLRFGPEMREFAKSKLEGQKGQTFSTVVGSVSFTKKKKALKLNGVALAVQWARKYFNPEVAKGMIKVEETFQISTVPDIEKVKIQNLLELAELRDRFSELIEGDDTRVLSEEESAIYKAGLKADFTPLDDVDIEALRAVWMIEPASESYKIKTGVTKPGDAKK